MITILNHFKPERTSAHALGRPNYGPAKNANGAHLGLGNVDSGADIIMCQHDRGVDRPEFRVIRLMS